VIEVRQLPPDQLAQLVRQIDRSEEVRTAYTYEGGELRSTPMRFDDPGWSLDEEGDHTFAAQVRFLQPILETGGVLLGAFEGETAVGFAVLRYQLTDGLAQLVSLYVSREYRRKGAATLLVNEIEGLAKADGAQGLYVSATPSGSAVGFYLRHGFVPTDTPHPDLFELEPEDIHMIKPL
jgi:GNAT superfamily N-acetyltransferase